MAKKIIKKIKEIIEKKKEKEQPVVERRKGERRSGTDRRWMSKLVGGPEIPFERRSGSDRRMGDRRKK
jgi:hypothetical protein